MATNARWEKSTKGPDWTDVEMLMRAISGLHGGHVAVVISPCGIGSSGGVNVVASILCDVLPGSALPPSIQVSKAWPCNMHATLDNHVFSLLHDLDYQIGQTYRSEVLWE